MRLSEQRSLRKNGQERERLELAWSESVNFWKRPSVRERQLCVRETGSGTGTLRSQAGGNAQPGRFLGPLDEDDYLELIPSFQEPYPEGMIPQ